MLNLLDLPIALRIFLVLLLGLVTARFINWAIYTWAYFPRRLGPWTAAPQKIHTGSSREKKRRRDQEFQKTRSWRDHLPILGWWRLRDESTIHGQGYWVRPLLIELIYPLVLAWYYRFQTTGMGFPPGAAKLVLPLQQQLHAQFIGHWILFSLMTIATFIDFDEQSIPDYVTLPGTVLGILGSVLAPLWLPLTYAIGVVGVIEMPAYWPVTQPAWYSTWIGLLVAILILATWGFALLDRRIILRRGYYKAAIYFWARMFRHRQVWGTVMVTTLGLMIFTTACWWWQIARWEYLISSLLGMAFAGGVTWAVRVSATYAYGMEALGFGDVTLMAMIGAFIGWQPSLVVFFLAPFVAMLFVIIRWIITRETATPYGPYLCGAVLVLLVFWEDLWLNRMMNLFGIAEDVALMLGPQLGFPLSGADVILGGITICVLLIGGMLWTLQLVKLMMGSTVSTDAGSP